MIALIKYEGKFYARNAEGRAEQVDRQMRFQNIFLPETVEPEYVDLNVNHSVNLKWLDAFAKALTYKDAYDFYYTFRCVQLAGYLHDVTIQHMWIGTHINFIEMKLCGRACDLFFDDVSIIENLTGCRVHYQPDSKITRIFIGVPESGT